MVNGKQHVHNLMHVLIEGIAAGVYDSLDDIQADAQEYLQMEKAVEKLENWSATDKIEDLAQIFEGLSNSIHSRKNRLEEEKRWDSLAEMPDIPELKELENLLGD